MKIKIYLFSTFLSILFLTFSCKENNQKSIPTKEITFTKEGELELFQLQDTIYQLNKRLDIELAENDYEQETGLMYRNTMKSNQGMLFIFEDNRPRSFYMKNTKIPLDLLFINDENKVVSIKENARPLDEQSLPSGKPAKYVLEINAGLVQQWNVKAGDSVSYRKMK